MLNFRQKVYLLYIYYADLSAALLKLKKSRKMEHGRCQSFFCPSSISGMAHGMTAENYGCLVKWKFLVANGFLWSL